MAYYVTTSIPYVNAAPHLGHALEDVQADAFARYHRLVGDNTLFLTGTDENSLKNVLAAEREGVPVRDLVDRFSRRFLDLTQALNVTPNDFIRTSIDPRHLSGVRKFWEACRRRGDVYRRAYRGLYCMDCEQFYTPDELVDGLCPEHLTKPEVVDEENYFFRLSRYADQLLQLIDSERLRIIPDARRNEVRAFVKRGLQDLSISRSSPRAHTWSIQVPGDPDQVIYVWFDALTNYITALGYADDADYSDARLEHRHTADLANGLGNLLNRTASMVVRYRQGVVPTPGGPEPADRPLLDVAHGLAGQIQHAMEDDYDPQAALAAIWAVVDEANRYVERTAPWSLARAEKSGEVAARLRLDAVLYHLVESLRIVGEALLRFLPETAERMVAQLGGSTSAHWLDGLAWSDRSIGASLGKPQQLFPRLE